MENGAAQSRDVSVCVCKAVSAQSRPPLHYSATSPMVKERPQNDIDDIDNSKCDAAAGCVKVEEARALFLYADQPLYLQKQRSVAVGKPFQPKMFTECEGEDDPRESPLIQFVLSLNTESTKSWAGSCVVAMQVGQMIPVACSSTGGTL